MLRVLPVGRAEQVQRPRAVLTVAPRAGAALLLNGVKVGRVHRMGDLGLVGCRLLPQIAGEVQLGEERVGFDLAGAVGAQAVFGRAAEAADDVNGLGTEFDLGRHLQGALPVDDLQREEGQSVKLYYVTKRVSKCQCLVTSTVSKPSELKEIVSIISYS